MCGSPVTRPRPTTGRTLPQTMSKPFSSTPARPALHALARHSPTVRPSRREFTSISRSAHQPLQRGVQILHPEASGRRYRRVGQIFGPGVSLYTRTLLSRHRVPNTALTGGILENFSARFKTSMAASSAEMVPSCPLCRWDSVSIVET